MPYCTEKEFEDGHRTGRYRIKGEPAVEQQLAKAKSRKITKTPELAPPMVAGQIREGVVTRLEILLPIRTESELNRRDHWAAAAARKKAQRNEVEVEWARLCKGVRFQLPAVVVLTRIGAQALDSDNLSSSFKAIRDQIAETLGVDDGSEMIRFEYRQIVDRRYGYGVKIEILRPFEFGNYDTKTKEPS
jgi:hypothetical protein